MCSVYRNGSMRKRGKSVKIYMRSRAVARIYEMERCYDSLQIGIKQDPPYVDVKAWADLLEYYEGGQWLADFEMDEKGLLPRDLKRGVLSEDGLYDLLSDVQRMKDLGGTL